MDHKYAVIIKKSSIPQSVRVREGVIKRGHHLLVVRQDYKSGSDFARQMVRINPDFSNGHQSVAGVLELDPKADIHQYANWIRGKYFGESNHTDMFTEEVVFSGGDSLIYRIISDEGFKVFSLE